MSEGSESELAPRLEEFRKEVSDIGVTGGAANPERTGSIIGVALLTIGLAVAIGAAVGWRGDNAADPGNATAMLSEVVSSNNGIIIVVLGLSTALVGGMLWVRNSLTRYFRYWLVRLVYEDRANTDRLIEAIRAAGGDPDAATPPGS